jgi:hypothetical protein
MIRFLRWLIDPPRIGSVAEGASERPPLPPDDDLSWFFPPNDVRSPAAWDAYWKAQIDHGVPPQWCDLFCDDDFLLDAMQARSLSTVLCVGSGLSSEPRALAAAGLCVTALDLSPYAMSCAGTLECRGSGQFFDPQRLRAGGSVTFVAGDLMDQAVCPGPYDVIIERKTLQLFPDEERPRALRAVLARLSPQGILLTHCHDGCWRPPAAPRHHVEPLLEPADMRVAPWGSLPEGEGQCAFIFTSTG